MRAPAPAGVLRSASASMMKSASNACPPCAASQKYSRLPSGERTAGMFSSSLPMRPVTRGQASASARTSAAWASTVASASAQTEVPCTSKWLRANESCSRFSTMRTSPWPYRSTSFERCRPMRAKPRLVSCAARRVAVAGSTANSMNDQPVSTGGGGSNSGTVTGLACGAGGVWRTCSSSHSSERIASTALARAGAERNSSLKISSEIGPV